MHPEIPPTSGTLNFVRVDAEQGDAGPLGPGRWCVSPLTTVPMVSVDLGQRGPRLLTWGQSIEIPEGQHGKVRNASWHRGDLWFDGIGSGCGHTGLVPRAVTIAVDLVLVPGLRPGLGYYMTTKVDTRFARRAFLVWEPPADGVLEYRVNFGAPRRGLNYTGTTSATGGAEWKCDQKLRGYLGMMPLGLHSGQHYEPAPGLLSLADPRPMALWDYAYARWDESMGVAVNLTVGRSLWALLEY